MKKTVWIGLIFISIAGLLYTSCEPVQDPADSDPRIAYTGDWQFLENTSLKSTNSQSYVATISIDSSNSSQVLISNFENSGPKIITTGIVTSGQLVVSSQTLSNGWIVEGAGIMANSAKTEMTWTYSITAGGDFSKYTAVATIK
jgi:hypothetical protein